MVRNIAIASVGGQGFDYWAGQIGHSVGNGSPPLRCFIGAALRRHKVADTDPSTGRTLRWNAASIMKI